MSKLQFKNKWVLVTGASSGLGEEMARQLAFQHGTNLILLARRKDKLEQLKAELENAAGVSVKIIVADLSKLHDVDHAIDQLLADGQLYAAILNAGVTYFGKHSELTWEQFQTMLQTNVVSVVRFTNRLVSHFESTGKEGGVLIVSSMAALFPVPFQAAYSGTKSFILSFATALDNELKNPGFSLSVYAPGGIVTEMTAGDNFHDLQGWLMPVKQAAKEGIDAFRNRKLVYVPGVINRVGNFFLKFLPKRFIMGKMGKVYEKSLIKAADRNSKP
ncbi:MAG: SDR family NAD(P)-dependent oxidoreductase [Bacteroidetes bacterium]|jgi:short-subunit dehydrogenase|nr:SDR family NAD(P)-dependent oxidoreductase [Bacteroidota bacterium]